MALSISNHSLLSPRLSPSFLLKPSATLTLHFQRHCTPLSRRLRPLSASSSSPIVACFNSTGRSFRPSHAVRDPFPSISDEEEASQTGSEADNVPKLKTLMRVYRQAVLEGDINTVSEIEAVLYSIDKERNELVQNVSALSAEITSGKEKYIRLQADFDNFRKRSDKDRFRVRDNAKGEVMESLLPMVDSFERAKQQIKPETEMEKKIDTSYQGIYKQFVEIMRSLSVSAVPTVGKPFDPALHEAIAREESEQFKEGIIIQEFRRGFSLGDRLLRPAMVKVSAGPGSKKDNQVPKPDAAATAGIDER